MSHTILPADHATKTALKRYRRNVGACLSTYHHRRSEWYKSRTDDNAYLAAEARYELRLARERLSYGQDIAKGIREGSLDRLGRPAA